MVKARRGTAPCMKVGGRATAPAAPPHHGIVHIMHTRRAVKTSFVGTF